MTGDPATAAAAPPGIVGGAPLGHAARRDHPAGGIAGGAAGGARVVSRLVLANVVIDVLAFACVRWVPDRYVAEIAAVALAVSFAVNVALVHSALLPLRSLEAAAGRVARGDLAARVELPPYADRDLRRVGTAFNHLLDTVAADRARVHTLAAGAIRAADQERASIARDLHDSTAQQLAALDLLLAATAREDDRLAGGPGGGGAFAKRLGVMQEIVGEALHEVRALAHSVHPRVLEEMGLTAALEALAGRTRDAARVEVRVSSDVRAAVPPAAAATLYRVAQEALRNAVRHGAPRAIDVAVTADALEATLVVADDGRGFDPAGAERARTGLGLFTMRERAALAGGRVTVTSGPGRGTRVEAVVPVAGAGYAAGAAA